MSAQRDIRTDGIRLHCTINAGPGPEILFLNGAFTTGRDWKKVVRQLPPDAHTVRFDARGRGRSADSADYSFSGALQDVERVIEATGLRNPVLVGWSHGATLAVRHAATHPGRVAGLVLIDGALPVRIFRGKAPGRIHRQYRMLGLPLRVLGIMRLASRMNHRQAAEVVLELDRVDAGLLPDYRALDCPTLLVLGSGPHFGSPASEMSAMRAAADPAVAQNPRVHLYTTVPSNHLWMLRRDAATIADAIRAVTG
ncbi:alpha/beta fold hydrolase [Paeniglutamicibacter cryotolerans]|uniref:Pimeloyl-ACP methyl ester carboxylesterase n=1 Tax=Paeniglutamicibacter cryotolerans TaxID=670079 RepID=A0A839QN06_9MICC|nr:alpha/beta hydrolase [Paeniglutamicibacter cryotolerans]MBB2996973.1 pimeloyl-ACP methyl ester carboxylesterase [Paeniglutamicibacter cryotolerans]